MLIGVSDLYLNTSGCRTLDSNGREEQEVAVLSYTSSDRDKTLSRLEAMLVPNS